MQGVPRCQYARGLGTVRPSVRRHSALSGAAASPGASGAPPAVPVCAREKGECVWTKPERERIDGGREWWQEKGDNCT